MSNRILHKRASVAGRVPQLGDLQLGELAINTVDGRLFLKKNVSGTESIVQLGEVTLSGDVSGSGAGNIAVTLANSGVSAGSYSSVTVDAKGRVTAGSSVATITGGNISGVALTGSSINGTAIGATTASTGRFTSLSTTSNATVAGSLTVSGNLVVSGTTSTVNSTTVTIDDPVFTLGGDVAPTLDDGKDRGIEFRWHNGSVARTGFFGFDDSTGKFTFIPDATNTGEVFSGTKGILDANIEFADVLNKPTTLAGYGVGVIPDAHLSGNYTGVNISGNAGTATKLATARTINGVAFDGTANITVADATKLPLSGGKMTGALAHQFLAGAAGVTTYRNLAVYTNSAATVTGTMKITLPFGWTSTMMSLKLKGFNYNVVGAWELSLGGYNYGSGSWVNTSASTMGTSVPFSSVRFAFDGTNACILLGNTASTWNYPKVIIEEMLAGFSNVELDWGNGWSITVIQDETGLSAFNEPVLNANTNALLLNGRDSAYYLDAGNLVGTVPSARLSGTYGISISGNAATATTATNATNATNATSAASAAKLATARTISITGDVTGSATFDGSANISINAQLPDYTAWNSSSAKDGVVGMLGWRHYGNSHVIFDASASTAPNGVAKSNTNPDNAWTPQYPTLMGWNGTSTYGVRVDRARYAESLTSNITINGVAANVGSNITIADSTKLPLAGGSLSGALKVVVNTAGSNYGDGQLELRNSDAGHVSMGFHRGGYTACQLRHSGNGLILSGTGQTTAADLYVYGNVTAYSDERLKTDIETIPEALAKVEQMNGVTFAKTNEEEARRHTGVIAQEVLAVLPEAVHMGDDGFYSVAYGNLAGLFIQAIKELNAKVDALTAEVETLRGQQ